MGLTPSKVGPGRWLAAHGRRGHLRDGANQNSARKPPGGDRRIAGRLFAAVVPTPTVPRSRPRAIANTWATPAALSRAPFVDAAVFGTIQTR